jgi:hypothetical protein
MLTLGHSLYLGFDSFVKEGKGKLLAGLRKELKSFNETSYLNTACTVLHSLA